MTSDPPPTPENPGLPPRHRMSLEKLRKEATESELWELEDDGLTSDPTPSEQIDPTGRKSHLPGKKVRGAPSNTAENPPSIQLHPDSTASSSQKKLLPRESTPRKGTLDDFGELDALDDWDETESPLAKPKPEAEVPADQNVEPGEPSAKTTREIKDLTKTHDAANRRKKTITRNEIIGIATLAIALVIGAGLFIFTALSGLPRENDPHQQPDLPIKGNHITINAVDSYWRAPVSTGPDADTVQRGTELLPVLEITATGTHGSLRVQFHNSDGDAVGDPITHTVRGETMITIPSTAGMDDANVHNAYRTNLIDPWTAEILEASAGTTSGSSFRKLISIPISAHRR